MHLVPCHPPKGDLDEAPRSALTQNSSSESWEGFWCEDRYYTRRTRADGGVQWFRIVDSRRTVFPLPRAPYFTSRRAVFLVTYVEPQTRGNDRRTVLIGRRGEAR